MSETELQCAIELQALEVLNFLMKSVFDQMIDLMRLFIIYMILILFNTVK